MFGNKAKQFDTSYVSVITDKQGFTIGITWNNTFVGMPKSIQDDFIRDMREILDYLEENE